MLVINAEFISLYDKIRGTLFDNYSKVSNKAGLSSLQNDLNAITYQSYERCISKIGGEVNEGVSTLDLQSRINACASTDIFKVFEFIVLAGLSSYYGLSNLNEYVNTGNNFGYKNSFSGLKKLCLVNRRNGSDFESASLERLLSSQRDCSPKAYFENESYVEDIKLVDKLLRSGTQVDIDADLNEAVVLTFLPTIKEEVANIVAVYKDLLAASFGLSKYKGVFTLNKTAAVVGLSNSYRYSVIEPNRVFAEKYTPIIKDMVEIATPSDKGSAYTDRQFDHSVIYSGYKSHKEKPVYFPHKILELISLGYWSTTRANVYKGCPNNESLNLSSYCELLAKCFEDDLFVFCAYACKMDYSLLGTDKWSLYDVITSGNYPKKQAFEQSIKNKLRYYSQCVTTCIILTDLDTENREERGVKLKDILSFRLKVSVAGNLVSNEHFCRELSSTLFNNKSTMSDVESTTESTYSIGIHTRDYAYTFNADKVYARPVFAYKALTALQEQQMQIDWRNMLLGKYADGSICRSAVGEKINLQGTQLHNIYAGSRSGKGVMCFNIFATAIASKIPIFYIDRKPDTAVILKSLAPKMFAVNGGQYDATIDLEVQFDPRSIKYQIPDYVASEFTDMSVRNDYIYFRAMLLLFSLAIFMDKVQNKGDERFQRIAKLLGSGAVFVFDEFSNFTDKFLSSVPTTQNWFKECYSKSGIGAWKGLLSDIGLAKLELDAKQATGKEDQIAKAERKLETAIDKSKEFDISKVYFAELSDCYKDTVKTIAELYRAGGAFVKQVQMFIIGQTIPSEYYDSNDFFTLSNGASVKRFNSSVHDAGGSRKPDIPLIRMLNNIGGDYIFGHQPKGIGDPRYMAQGKRGTISSSMLSASRRCFCYYNPNGAQSYSQMQMIRNTEEFFKGRDSEMNSFLENKFTYFKPFLILNNAVVPPEDLLQADLPNNGVSEELALKRQAKGNYAQYKESQYIGQCLTSCNKAGLTWNDLLTDNQTEKGTLSEGVGFEGYITQLCGTVPVDSMSLSGDIMDIFVNEVFGYKDGNWLDFLADFRPEAMFKPSDFLCAVDTPDSYGVQSRLADSFFSEALTKNTGGMSFASVFSDKLGTLLDAYNTEVTKSATVDVSDDDVEGINFVLDEDESETESGTSNTVSSDTTADRMPADFSGAEVQSNLRRVDANLSAINTPSTGNTFEDIQHNRRLNRRNQISTNNELQGTLSDALNQGAKENLIAKYTNVLYNMAINIVSANNMLRTAYSNGELKIISGNVAVSYVNYLYAKNKM